MARVFRRSFPSTPGTLALSLYWPVSGFKSMSPASQLDAESAHLDIRQPQSQQHWLLHKKSALMVLQVVSDSS